LSHDDTGVGDAPEPTPGGWGTRWLEAGVAVVLMVLGAIVVADALRIGRGWVDGGPQAGYFTFYIGLGLILAAGWVLVSQLRRWRADAGDSFASATQIKSVVAVFLPMVIYVALIAGVGIYVASALLIGGFMHRHGQFKLWLTAAVAVGVPLLVFFVFERWFLVPLPKSPLADMLGF
jgi:putative tricarboxylic transport membrane protein